jgi:hypothetical protein
MKASRRNLPLGLGVQSQGAHVDVDKSLNLVQLVGETNHPQLDELEPEKVILLALRS